MVSRSDIGRIRQVNEDSALTGNINDQLSFAIVADGMGGHQAGDVASQIAVKAFQRILQQHEEITNWSAEDGKRLMRIAIRQANDEIFQLAKHMEQYHNMGTTIVAALLWDHMIIVGHVGDSRAYRINEQGIHQLTEDHSLVNALVQSGQLTAEEAEHHPRKNVLTRAIGTDDDVEVDVRIIEWDSRDILLLCSDGLSNRVSESQLHQIVMSQQPLATSADQLILLANEAGGEDNITLVLYDQNGHVQGKEETL
ncbi:Stp1/IreP family PP2C-type Ser/Thr phosphatase [Paenibacillus endoradicis]|uniref:Stp1/IreP family PP2C-type Ser/Thr phosphatase n=1 Tax=Paenibacillus endoradicis TaxID=2972487 RepID=UPI00215968FC|nr:Stp1/IreP family PP2C-type Ser/Thr phosphatase [Paenibacillus endoradicis]MCR8656119.1 Stp1/IreP family PP2C-type Ser/Thr phosphatase [Paenibacillus endoradicis]MCR8658445.1 Stp1/IreP family PP2C-type Ser/Thr phosphatase [Paenibacillus endoradicis]